MAMFVDTEGNAVAFHSPKLNVNLFIVLDGAENFTFVLIFIILRKKKLSLEIDG